MKIFSQLMNVGSDVAGKSAVADVSKDSFQSSFSAVIKTTVAAAGQTGDVRLAKAENFDTRRTSSLESKKKADPSSTDDAPITSQSGSNTNHLTSEAQLVPQTLEQQLVNSREAVAQPLVTPALDSQALSSKIAVAQGVVPQATASPVPASQTSASQTSASQTATSQTANPEAEATKPLKSAAANLQPAGSQVAAPQPTVSQPIVPQPLAWQPSVANLQATKPASDAMVPVKPTTNAATSRSNVEDPIVRVPTATAGRLPVMGIPEPTTNVTNSGPGTIAAATSTNNRTTSMNPVTVDAIAYKAGGDVVDAVTAANVSMADSNIKLPAPVPVDTSVVPSPPVATPTQSANAITPDVSKQMAAANNAAAIKLPSSNANAVPASQNAPAVMAATSVAQPATPLTARANSSTSISSTTHPNAAGSVDTVATQTSPATSVSPAASFDHSDHRAALSQPVVALSSTDSAKPSTAVAALPDSQSSGLVNGSAASGQTVATVQVDIIAVAAPLTAASQMALSPITQAQNAAATSPTVNAGNFKLSATKTALVAGSSQGSAGVTKGRASNYDFKSNHFAADTDDDGSSTGSDAAPVTTRVSASVTGLEQNGTNNKGALETATLVQNAQAAQGAGQASATPAPALTTVDASALAAATPLPAQSIPVESAQVTHALNSAQLIQSIHGSEMRLGMQSPEFGNISINTSLSHGALSAQITMDHDALGHALAMHLPAIEEKLGSAYGVQAKVELRDTGSNSSLNDSGSGESTSDRRSQGGSNGSSTAAPQGAFGALTRSNFTSSTKSTSMAAAPSRLDIRI